MSSVRAANTLNPWAFSPVPGFELLILLPCPHKYSSSWFGPPHSIHQVFTNCQLWNRLMLSESQRVADRTLVHQAGINPRQPRDPHQLLQCGRPKNVCNVRYLISAALRNYRGQLQLPLWHCGTCLNLKMEVGLPFIPHTWREQVLEPAEGRLTSPEREKGGPWPGR